MKLKKLILKNNYWITASRKGVSPWRPVAFQPRSKDDTATYAFSSPPVPPPPPESDTEDFPPMVPPKPKVVRRKLYLSANQPQSGNLHKKYL